MVVTVLWIAVLVALLLWGSVASYLRLLARRLNPLAARQLFQAEARSRIRVDRERVGISISALHGASMALFAIGLVGLLTLQRPNHFLENMGAALVIVLGAVAVCDQLIPFLVLARRQDEPEVILARWMPFLRLSVFLALPLTFPILISTTVGRLLESPDLKPPEPNAQENLQELIDAGEEEGLIRKEEGELLQSLVEFGDKVIREAMTPRTEFAALEMGAPVEELRRLFREHRYTRYPVYTGEIDRIEGLVNVRDLMELPPEEQARVSLRTLVRPILFVPETKRTADLLSELRQTTTQMAIVVDEYGSVSGLVTMEDLVEEIVGEIRDEVEPHDRDIVRESARSFLVAGHTDLAQLAERLHVEFGARDYSTVGGLLLAHLGRVPARGEKCEIRGMTFEVLDADPRTVLKVRLRLSAHTPQAAPTHAEPRPL